MCPSEDVVGRINDLGDWRGSGSLYIGILYPVFLLYQVGISVDVKTTGRAAKTDHVVQCPLLCGISI